jgi:hypothetical protein
MYTNDSGVQDGVNLGTAVRMTQRVGRPAAVSNLDTLLDRGIGREVRMLLSFQRPSHLFRKGLLLRGTPENQSRFPGRTAEYSAQLPAL